MVVRELVTLLGFKANQADLNKINQTTEKVKTQAQSAANAVKGIALAFASMASIGKLVQIADNMQSIRSRIGMLPQTIGDVGAAFDEVAKRASASGASIDAYSSLYTRVGNAAKDYISTQEDLLGITDTISKALVVGGTSAQEASAVMIQFSQALASGVLQGDEFRSMAEAAPQYLQQLSEAMGIPRENLKKMASEGKLTARDVIEATRKMSNYFDARFKEMPMTTGMALQQVTNRFSAFIDKFNRKTQIIPKLANAIIKAFDGIEWSLRKVSDAFGGTENAIRFLGIAIGVALGAKAIAILNAFKVASLAAFAPYLLGAAIIAGIALVLEDIYVWTKGGASVTGDLLGNWEDVKPTVMAVWNTVKSFVTWFGEALAGVFAIFHGIFTLDWELIKAGFNGIFGWMIDQISNLASQIYDYIYNAIANALKNAWKAITGAATSFNTSESGLMAGMNPAKMTNSGMGAAGANINNNMNVNVTVPEGTSKEQAAFIQKAAEKSFSKNNMFANDLAVYGK